MKRFFILAVFSAFLTACGGNDAQKFVGEWIDPEPTSLGYDQSVTIKKADGNNVFVTYSVYGSEKTIKIKVDKNSLVDEFGKVMYKLIDDTKLDAGDGDILNKKQ